MRLQIPLADTLQMFYLQGYLQGAFTSMGHFFLLLSGVLIL